MMGINSSTRHICWRERMTGSNLRFDFALPAVLVVTEHGCADFVVLSINGAARIAVKVRTVGSPGDVIREDFHRIYRVEDDPAPSHNERSLPRRRVVLNPRFRFSSFRS